jgi:hypothetical protein
MTKPSIKEVITEAVINQLPENLRMFTTDECMRRWWQTGVRGDALRLTEMGDQMFRVADIEFYQYDFTKKIEGSYHNYILDLSRKIKCPYYLGVTKQDGKKNQPFIRLYDSKIAMMIGLYGDIDSYLKSVKIRR